MMRHKILIISPTPTHPTNAGNRARILVYSTFLTEEGHEVHFLYSDQEGGDLQAMQSFWGERFHYLPYQKPEPRPYPVWLTALNSNYRYYSRVDDHYNVSLDGEIRKLHKEHRFTAVIAEYIFNTRGLLNFGPEVLKLVDTHDRMTKRHKLWQQAGKQPVWYSTPRKEEKKGVDRADVVMAIQDREAAFYRKLTRKKVVTIGHLVSVIRPEKIDIPRKRLLFLGSNNPNNYYAITDFIQFYWPSLLEHFPGIELYVAGNICERVEDRPGIIKMGEVNDISNIYRVADLVVNPITIGTGLKIKNIESIGFGKVLISSSVGAEGLESGAGNAFLVADDPERFRTHLQELFSIPGYHSEIAAGAIRFATAYNRRPCEELKRIFS
ncbi:MAG TPA: glycosyltransferase family 4 protein [Bacteroidales bacterium]|nr:glycosyltransferase family 4 protein [Bacteroidales bacterium]HNS46855.1 glycosyltransferase family 4 protein [Bacteroidales bacterium]